MFTFPCNCMDTQKNMLPQELEFLSLFLTMSLRTVFFYLKAFCRFKDQISDAYCVIMLLRLPISTVNCLRWVQVFALLYRLKDSMHSMFFVIPYFYYYDSFSLLVSPLISQTHLINSTKQCGCQPRVTVTSRFVYKVIRDL